MKKVTFTYSMEFPDETDDSTCVDSLIEIMSQDRNYTDDQFKIDKVEKKEN